MTDVTLNVLINQFLFKLYLILRGYNEYIIVGFNLLYIDLHGSEINWTYPSILYEFCTSFSFVFVYTIFEECIWIFVL